jgi:hypothetical protein
MNVDKKARLEAAGWQVGSAADFLEEPTRRIRITFTDPLFGVVLTTVNPEKVLATIAELEKREFPIDAIALLEEGE